MKLQGKQLIPAARETVWQSLNDPEILKQCIPGCESLTKNSDTEFEAAVVMKVGPTTAKLKGAVSLHNIDAPNSYTIKGEGKGSVAGFARGKADVTLTEQADGTLLSYMVEAKVGGKFAQIGSHMLDGTAKKLAREFFTRFDAISAPEKNMTDRATNSENTRTEPAAQAEHKSPSKDGSDAAKKGLPPAVWAIGVIIFVAVVMFAFSQP